MQIISPITREKCLIISEIIFQGKQDFYMNIKALETRPIIKGFVFLQCLGK